MVALTPFACLAFIIEQPIQSRGPRTAIAKRSTMSREVVDLLSSSSDSSSSNSSGLPEGIKLRNNADGDSGEELSGGDVHQLDEISSIDTIAVERNYFDVMEPDQINIIDGGSSSDSDIEILSNDEINADEKDEISSSSSSGLPGLSPVKRTMTADPPVANVSSTNGQSAESIEVSCQNAAPPTKRKITKRRAWGQKKAPKASNKQANESTAPLKEFSTFNHCYLLRSLDPDHPLKTYIGFTTHPSRRIRQHNGILKNGGARRTRRSGRPWTFCCIVGGFESKIAALQFEWAWQNVGKSKAFREAVGDDALARKMGRRRGVKARLDEMRILLYMCKPWCESDGFTVYFMEEALYIQFTGLLNKSETCGNIRTSELKKRVCSVEEMPFALDLLSKKKRAEKGSKSSSLRRSLYDAEMAELSSGVLDSNLSVVNKSEYNDEHSILGSSPERNDSNVDNLDIMNLSIDKRRYSWENLSLDSEVKTDIDSRTRVNEQESKRSNETSVDVFDLCSP